ncbi:hypothetical protein M3Y95_01264000 [Aphelenchoides besseyi]|nr:hypothetical protein M3Y95_01264000 [Aphelenchoides besseyi]
MSNKLSYSIIAFDTWNETEIVLCPTERSLANFHFDINAPFYIDDCALVQLFGRAYEINCDDIIIKMNVANRTFEVQSLGTSEGRLRDFDFVIARESDWLLIAEQRQTCLLFWFNTKTKELKQVEAINLAAPLLHSATFYKNHQLYTVDISNKKIQRYDLTQHLPWLPTSETKSVLMKEAKIKGPLTFRQWCSGFEPVKQQDNIVFCNAKRGHCRILNLNTGTFKGFKLPSDVNLDFSLNFCPIFVFDDDILTIHSKVGHCCNYPEQKIRLKSTRFALRRPESLFNLAWFQRPRDLSLPKFMAQRGFTSS